MKPGEEDGLEAEARLLQNSERIMKAVDSSYQQLDEEDAILSRLARVRDQLQYAARYDSVWRRWQSVLTVLDQLGRLPHGAERIYGRQ